MTEKGKQLVQPKGEAWVWLTSMGITIGLLMIVLMLGLIVVKGLNVFWPKPIMAVELAKDLPEPVLTALQRRFGEEPRFAGVLVESRRKMSREMDAQGDLAPAQKETQFFIGSRELYDGSFIWIDTSFIAEMELLPDAIAIERAEYGDVLALPVALRSADGTEIKAASDGFREALAAALDEVSDGRRQIHQLDRKEIGRINTAMTAINLELRSMNRAEASGGATDTPKREALTARLAALQVEFEVLEAQLKELREKLNRQRLVYRLVSGGEHEISMGEVIDYTYPNEMNLLQRLGHFLWQIWRFVSEEPREANTEGGIWPAIFGTFVMTVLMSMLVTPFGVVAAIYLREYAKQGTMVAMVRIAINNLAGVPSIVFGVFGLGFFVWGMGGTIDELFYADRLPTATFGTGGILWASLTLALLTVPVVIVASEEALAAVPRGTREGALACGASRWQTIQRVVLPAAAPGVLTGVILAMARGAGEVAPLMLVGVVKIAPELPVNSNYPFIHLDQKFMHLGFHIYDLGFQSPDAEAAKPMVFATALLLIALVVVLNLTAIIIREHLRRKYATSAF